MHARVVRFTDVTPDRIAEIVSQGTAIFVGFFETEQKMRDASAVFEQMDASETPGTRASVDHCEVKAEAAA
jgi:hypothetical protein